MTTGISAPPMGTTKVIPKTEMDYLGVHLNEKGDTTLELNNRIKDCMISLKKLDLFWLHAECSVALKIQVYDAVIKAKLLYGLETTQLTGTSMDALDIFQLKGLIKMFKYIN